MSYRLLHLADLHLDRAFASMGCQGELARRRRQGLRDALQRAGTVARERDCQAITVGGDLYEHERSGVDTGRFLAETFAAWRPMRVFIAPGNHDALMPGSLYRITEWPANVHVFSEPRLVPVRLDDRLSLWGLAHREPAWTGNPLDGVAASAQPGTHLALFHGAELASRPEGKSIHGPFHVEQIRQRGFAAALCGHYHRRRLDVAAGLLYPGSPEPLTFDESGGRGPVLVDVSDAGVVSFQPQDSNRWSVATAPCDVSAAASTGEVLEHAAAACAAAITGTASRTMVRVDLSGVLDGAVSIDTGGVEVALRERLDLASVKVRDLTSLQLDIEAVAAERSARGAFARAARAAIDAAGDDEAADSLREALRYGLAALSGAEIGLR